jgi:hypothetical protein
MIPVGYIAKKVAQRPEWLKAPNVKDIYSVSSCVSDDFMDYTNLWRHNGYWLFDNPQIIKELAQENGVDLKDLTFFYYEAYEFPTNVDPPANKEFQGYDVVTFSMNTNPECSPLSCNHMASEIRTNVHCLFESFEEAKQGLELGKFDHTEPGPFRIFAVHTIDSNH